MRITTTVVALVLGVALMAVPASAQDDLAFDVLSTDTSDPTQIQVAEDGRVIWVEREGGVNVLTPEGEQVEAARIPVSAHQCTYPGGGIFGLPGPQQVLDLLLGSSDEDPGDGCAEQDSPHVLEEGGLMGVLLTQDFATSNRIYLYWSVPGTFDPETRLGTWRLATFVLDPETNLLDLDSEEVLLEVPAEWPEGHHYGGNLEWMPDGTILLSMGDDTRYPSSGGYGPRDHRADYNNAEVTSQNPANLRGKILRLMPDGSVPDGSVPGIAANPFIGETMDNPYICLSQTFDEGGPGNWDRYTQTCPDEGWPTIEYNPYIYSMGWKQPWRGVVFPDGSAIYGDVGPDAGADDPQKGPRGHEELNRIAPGGGDNHGWPRCTADQIPYGDFNWADNTYHGPLSCEGFEPSLIWYTNAASERWPAVGTGGKTSEPVVVYTEDVTGPLRLPARFDNTMLVMEFSRDWFKAIPFDEDYDLDLDSTTWQDITKPTGSAWGNPLDAVIGPDGALYTIEYGNTYWNNTTSQITRVRCAGCAPEDPARNYGLPVPGVGEGATASTGGTPLTALAIALAILALGAFGHRRRATVAV